MRGASWLVHGQRLVAAVGAAAQQLGLGGRGQAERRAVVLAAAVADRHALQARARALDLEWKKIVL